MSTPIDPPTPDPPTPDGPQHGGHEKRDVQVRAVAQFGLGVMLLILGSLAVIHRLVNHYNAEADQAAGPTSPLAADQTPPEPRLETTVGGAFDQYRARTEQVLTTYAWIDREQRVVRIPVARAIELLAKRGLPEPKQLTTPAKERKP
ncbi:MAG: hypothetical protein JSS27_05290 [Planctomycetes bacterium]|nr:hypothetical protein [Planctomycetota bacterium]